MDRWAVARYVRHSPALGVEPDDRHATDAGSVVDDGSDNVVEVYMGYLRREIDAPFGLTKIENHSRCRLSHARRTTPKPTATEEHPFSVTALQRE
ncbi:MULTISPECIES: hypothetical protein [Nocardia]|uniref:hypothetical protein n=1 Tax=Nocardia TaxID=1817 RepID=UPI0018E54047|nr:MULTISPECIES: hypothetical protein [Nocardia]